MEIKAQLKKPCSVSQRADFIVENNHKKHFDIRETEIAIEAWGLTQEEVKKHEKEAQKMKLIGQLDSIDLLCIRPLRAKAAGKDTDFDLNKLAELEAHAEELRQQIRELEEAQ